MNAMIILGGLFFFVIVAFIAGMFLLPEFFGISKGDDDDKSTNDEKVEK